MCESIPWQNTWEDALGKCGFDAFTLPQKGIFVIFVSLFGFQGAKYRLSAGDYEQEQILAIVLTVLVEHYRQLWTICLHNLLPPNWRFLVAKLRRNAMQGKCQQK